MPLRSRFISPSVSLCSSRPDCGSSHQPRLLFVVAVKEISPPAPPPPLLWRHTFSTSLSLNSLPLYLPFPPSFLRIISQKAPALSWRDTAPARHQLCLPPSFDRGIRSPLPSSLLSPPFLCFLPPFFLPPSSHKLSFVAHCLGGI